MGRNRERIPTTNEVERHVVRTVAGHLGIRPSDLQLDSHLRDQLGADLLDRIELVVTVEEEFGITLDSQSLMAVETVRDVITLVEQAVIR